MTTGPADGTPAAGTAPYILLQQQLISVNARFDRQVSQLQRVNALSNELLHRPGQASETETLAEAVAHVLDIAVGLVWLLPPHVPDGGTGFAAVGPGVSSSAWAAAGPALAERMAAGRGALRLDPVPADLLPGAELVDVMAARCVGRDGSCSAIVLAANTPTTAGMFEPVTDDTLAMLSTFAEKVAAHLDNAADLRLIEAQVARLEGSEDRLRRVLQATSDGWWDWDLTSDQCFLSARWQLMVGIQAATATTRDGFWSDRIHPADRFGFDLSLERALSGDATAVEVELRLRREDGGWIPVLARGTVARDAEGAAKRFAGSILDLTERRRHEAEQQRVEAKLRETAKLEALGVLAGGIAHDFNNLLGAIIGHLDLARIDVPVGSPGGEDLEAAEAAAGRAADLARQMLAYSGRGTLAVVPVSLEQMLREMGGFMTSSITKNARLVYAFEPNLPSVLADITQLRQVALNLIVNASDAMEGRPGTITLRAGRTTLEADDPELIGADATPGDYVMLEVSDTGHGMDEATLARIFDPFFSTKSAGRGLGLAAMLGTVKSHEGAIRVRSAPGQGTRFQVLLRPTSAAASTGTMTPDARPAPSAAGRILIVDDETSVLFVARRMLERSGFTVTEAGDGPEGLEWFGSEPDAFTAVLLDLTLPTLDGVSVLEGIRALRPEMPVVICSGWTASEVANRLRFDARTVFLQKPYRTQALLDAITTVTRAAPT